MSGTLSGGGFAEELFNDVMPASKNTSRVSLNVELAESSTNIAAITTLLHLFRMSATLSDVEACVVGAATGDRTVTVDIEKSTGAGPFATIMSTTIDISSSTAALTAVFSDSTILDGDILRAVVTIGGATGTEPPASC